MAEFKLRPSGAPWWSKCPGGPAFTAEMEDPGNVYAAEGTAKHSLAEICGATGAAAANFIGQIIDDFDVTEDFAEDVQWAVDKMEELLGIGNRVWFEQNLPMDELLGPGTSGTADVVLYDATPGVLTIIDYKFGRHAVAADSLQLLIYALAAKEWLQSEGYPVGSIRTAVVQPAISHFETHTIGDESQVQDFITNAAIEANEEDAPRIPGPDQCQWCLGKATCPELRREVSATVGDMDADPFVAYAADDSDDDAQLADDLENIPLIQSWCKARLAYAEQLILGGTEVPGWKVVAGKRGTRKWSDEQAAMDLLNKRFRIARTVCTVQKVLSPTQALKMAGKQGLGPKKVEQIEGLITQAEGKPAVVHEDDKRPALAVAQFDNLESNDE